MSPYSFYPERAKLKKWLLKNVWIKINIMNMFDFFSKTI